MINDHDRACSSGGGYHMLLGEGHIIAELHWPFIPEPRLVPLVRMVFASVLFNTVLYHTVL